MRPRFLADCNVGRLARWLRALGYDASYHARIGDSELVREAAAENRVVLTRDRDALTRCIECNSELESRMPAVVAERVPPYVRRTQSRYSECPDCGRIYWAGTHWQRMREVLLGL